MNLKVARKPLNKASLLIKPDRHCICIHYGRFEIVAKVFIRQNNDEREYSITIPSVLYFSKGSQQCLISATQDGIDPKKWIKFNPFFDLELDNLFIGDEENQTEVELEEIIQVLTNQVLDRLLPDKYKYVDIVYTSFSEIPRFVKGIQEALDAGVYQRAEQYKARHLEKAAVHNASATFQFMQNKTIVNGQPIDIGLQEVLRNILEAARQQFNDKLYRAFLKAFITQNGDQYYATGQPIVTIILEQQIKQLKASKLYGELLAHKTRWADFHVRNVTTHQMEFVISAECISRAQQKLAEAVVIASKFKLVQPTFDVNLPELGKPVVAVWEEGQECFNALALQKALDNLFRFRANVKVLSVLALLEAALRTVVGGEKLDRDVMSSRSVYSSFSSQAASQPPSQPTKSRLGETVKSDFDETL